MTTCFDIVLTLCLGIIEAKAYYKKAGDGLQQAKEYAKILDLKFAFSSNGTGIIEHNFLTGIDTILQGFPTPEELWQRLMEHEKLADIDISKVTSPVINDLKKPLRYYQEVAIGRIIKAVVHGQKRILLTMATGTGKTTVQF